MYVPLDYRRMVAAAGKAIGKANEILVKWDKEPVADETSLLFASPGELDAFLKWASVEGIEHFNSVPRDTMLRRDIPHEEFDVRFEFMRVPGADWRIEAMCVLSGQAPLHDKQIMDHGTGCVVHVSWKESDHPDYVEALQHLLLKRAVPIQAEYRNSYGRFAYLRGSADFYLKPRVNLRDI